MYKATIMSIVFSLAAGVVGLSQTDGRLTSVGQGRVPGGIQQPKISSSGDTRKVVRTKDGLTVGKRDEFIASCATSTNNTFKFKDIDVDSIKYCTCFTDNIIPMINSWELIAAMKNNKIVELLTDEKYYSTLMRCFENNFKPGQDFKYGESGDIETEKKFAVKHCTSEMLKNSSDKNNISAAKATAYCECATDKLIQSNFKYKDLLEIENFNSKAFNELVVPCINLLQDSNDKSNPDSPNENHDVMGSNRQSIVPLMMVDNMYRVKLSIAGISNFFLIDTGASSLIINRETERALLVKGGLKLDGYLNKTEYKLANNQTVLAQMVKIESIVIGDYTVKNVVAAVIDEANLICGNNVLEKFQKWEINKRKKALILYK